MVNRDNAVPSTHCCQVLQTVLEWWCQSKG